jgi:cytidylate kinase
MTGASAPSVAPPAHTDGIIIAIDGPAASGKSSTARAVAASLGYRHLDSGAFYRALTRALLDAGFPPERWVDLEPDALDELRVDGVPRDQGFRLRIAGRDATAELRSAEVNANVSRAAAVPAVRRWLLHALRSAGRSGGLVADGRDIGTVVFPDAELKVFLVCEPEERALRRLREQGATDPTPEEIGDEVERLLARDRLDTQRSEAPLLRAADAVQLDTTGLAFDAQVRAIVRLAEGRIRD